MIGCASRWRLVIYANFQFIDWENLIFGASSETLSKHCLRLGDGLLSFSNQFYRIYSRLAIVLPAYLHMQLIDEKLFVYYTEIRG